mgnify:CR=1 FL=1
MDRKENVGKFGSKGRGRGELIRYLTGQKLTNKKSILAKCYDCMGYYADGRIGCNMPHCPLYPKMPYKNAKTEGGGIKG